MSGTFSGLQRRRVRRMLANLALRGTNVHGYMVELGRRAGIASGVSKRRTKAIRELEATQPRLAALLRASDPTPTGSSLRRRNG